MSTVQRLVGRFLFLGILLGTVDTTPAQWTNVTGNLADMPTECGNLCLLSVVPGQDKIIAGVAQRGLWQTTDGGATWTPLGQGAGSDTIVNRSSRIVYDPTQEDVFWESGIYNQWGVYQTTDGGQTFRHLGKITHNDYVSVCFSDPQRHIFLAGGHEQSRTVWKSLDGGQTWTNIGATLPEGTKFSSNPLLIDASTYLVNASGWGKGIGGVYRTTDGGASWSLAANLEATGAPLEATDGSIYWMLMYARGIIRSTDRGLTWTQVCGAGVLKGPMIIELPDGRLAAVGSKTVKVSADHGTSWSPAVDQAPIQPSGVIYAPARRAFYIWQWDCGNKVLTNAVWCHEYQVQPKPPR
jgi:photosystem II stability/assembly factor-like uncharacterized protein